MRQTSVTVIHGEERVPITLLDRQKARMGVFHS